MAHSPNQNAQAVTVSKRVSDGAALFTISSGAEHTYFNNQPITTSSSAAPGGFTDATTYYVVGKTATSFALSATPSGAPIAFSTAGTTVTTLPISGTFRVLRIDHMVTEQWLTGQANAAAAKAAAKDPTQFNQNHFWKRRRVMQLANPNEDHFEYVVSGADDGT